MKAAVLAHFNNAAIDQYADGMEWYAKAQGIACDIAEATGHDLAGVAGAMAHLSPRTRWSDNVHRTWQLAETGETIGLSRSIEKATVALAVRGSALDVLDTFGPKAWKTRSFFTNIWTGGRGTLAVTVDIWAARAVGWGDADLSKESVYGDIADAYSFAAAEVGISGAQMQAIVWCVVRGSSE